jgi:carbon monoxide dehydrogenase subunit G
VIHLTDGFTVPVSPERAYELLTDLSYVATCVPGGQIDAPDADGTYPGRVSVKLGPMSFTYAGTLRVIERDPETLTAVIAGAGIASGGAERASVRSTVRVVPDDAGARVALETDLDIKGRVAAMGAGIIGSVSRRMVKQTADCLSEKMVATS